MAKTVKTVAELERFLEKVDQGIQALNENKERIAAQIQSIKSGLAHLLGKAPEAPEAEEKPARRKGRRRRKRAKRQATTLRQAVAEIMKSAGKPMRASEISEQLQTSGHKTRSRDPKNMVSAILGQGREFKRVSKGLYALKR